MRPITLDLRLIDNNPIIRDLRLQLLATKAEQEDDWVQLSADIFFFNPQIFLCQNTSVITRSVLDILGIE